MCKPCTLFVILSSFAISYQRKTVFHRIWSEKKQLFLSTFYGKSKSPLIGQFISILQNCIFFRVEWQWYNQFTRYKAKLCVLFYNTEVSPQIKRECSDLATLVSKTRTDTLSISILIDDTIIYHFFHIISFEISYTSFSLPTPLI